MATIEAAPSNVKMTSTARLMGSKRVRPKDGIPVAFDWLKDLRHVSLQVSLLVGQFRRAVGQAIPVEGISIIRLQNKTMRKRLGAAYVEIAERMWRSLEQTLPVRGYLSRICVESRF